MKAMKLSNSVMNAVNGRGNNKDITKSRSPTGIASEGADLAKKPLNEMERSTTIKGKS